MQKSNLLFTKDELISGNEIVFTNEETQDSIEVSYRKGGPNWANPLQAMFNGELFTYKTFNNFERKVNEYVEKYNLKKEENEVD